MYEDQISLQRLKTLHPSIQMDVELALRSCWANGFYVRITFGLRTAQEQHFLYQQGRTRPGKIVTWADAWQSYHNYGLAWDICLMIKGNDNLWDMKADMNGNHIADWMEVVTIFKQIKGCEWGGDWKRPKTDNPHFQLRFGLSTADLMRLKRENGYPLLSVAVA